MPETTVNDPAFGQLTWDGFQHGGWAGSFADAEYLSWGAAIAAALPDDEEAGDEEDDVADDEGAEGDAAAASKTGAQDLLSQMLSVAGAGREMYDASLKMIQAAQDFARRADAYDGALDAEPLRKAGRLKVVVRNPRELPPTAAQQAAWRAFRDGGATLAEQIAAALLAAYQRQRPERVRWWKIVYNDSPDRALPDVATPQAMRAIVRPKEVRVSGGGADGGPATVAVVLEAFWCHEDVQVVVRDGRVVGVDRLVESDGISTEPPPEEFNSSVFGRLRRGGVMGGWTGVFHSDALRGYDDASQTRHRFRQDPTRYDASPWRPGPTWDVITGDYVLSVSTEEDQRPTPEQEAAFARFNQDPAATARQVLSAILEWYRDIRPNWVEQMNGNPDSIDAVMPDVRSPEELLEIIQLQSVTVLPAPDPAETAGPIEYTLPFGPDAGKKLSRPAKKPGVAIVLSFHWEDEHGLGVRWRDGAVEAVGDWESAYDE
jgi:hypothetical protein